MSYNRRVATIVQARLDEKSARALQQLERLGLTPSRAVREGLELLAARYAGPTLNRIVGVGEFDSGVADLGSNKKKHLRGYGR